MSLTFGVEIEFILPHSTQASVAEAIQTAGVDCFAVGYNHQRSTAWKVVSDGSISGGGHELVSPVLTEAQIGQVDQVCAVLSGLRASVNRSCGLHIHVGARNLTNNAMKRLAALYAEGEDVIDQLLPPSRRATNNGYCRTLKGINPTRLAAAANATDIANVVSEGQRYSKLNFTAFWRHGTVEFRQHSGTIDPVKIKNWALFCLKMVETAQREEGQALQASPAAAPMAQVTSSIPALMTVNPYWRRGRRTRTIFTMLSRPEGASAEEVRHQLGVRAAPDIRWHLNRAMESGSVNFTALSVRSRGGVVYRLNNTGAPAVSRPVPVARPAALTLQPLRTLDELLTKLQLTPVERTYWVERQAMLSPTHE